MILLPYMTVAVMQYCLVRWQHGTWVCIPINHLGEVRQTAVLVVGPHGVHQRKRAVCSLPCGVPLLLAGGH